MNRDEQGWVDFSYEVDEKATKVEKKWRLKRWIEYV